MTTTKRRGPGRPALSAPPEDTLRGRVAGVVRRRRTEELGLTVRQAVDLAPPGAIDPNTWHGVEFGRRCTLENLVAVCLALKLQLHDLLPEPLRGAFAGNFGPAAVRAAADYFCEKRKIS